MPGEEVMMPVPTVDALRQTEVVAMRQISDNLALQSRTLERLVDRVEEVRDKVIQIEAQDLKAQIAQLRVDSEKRYDELSSEHDAAVTALRAEIKALEDIKLKAVADQVAANSRSISWLRGLFLPLGVIASAALTGLVTWIIARP